jgi:hypothetical protein
MDNFSEKQIQEQFARLPKVVQDAITSADIEKHLRESADTYKLHLDQWALLENQVMLTLMGLQRAENLRENILKNVGTDEATAAALAAEISRIVFTPVCEEMERQLAHPDAQVKIASGMDAMRTQTLAANTPAPIASVPVSPDTKAVRAPLSPEYKPGATSSTRKDVTNDPYRVSPV